MSIRIGINGFGRIGRLVYRIAANDPGFEVVAVNDLVPADNLAYLLKYDTMHGRFQINHKPAEVSATESSFTVNGTSSCCVAIASSAWYCTDVRPSSADACVLKESNCRSSMRNDASLTSSSGEMAGCTAACRGDLLMP